MRDEQIAAVEAMLMTAGGMVTRWSQPSRLFTEPRRESSRQWSVSKA